MDGEFTEYEGLNCSPQHIHKSKTDHKRAVFYPPIVRLLRVMHGISPRYVINRISAALVRDGVDVLSSVVSSQIDLHAIYGGVAWLQADKNRDAVIKFLAQVNEITEDVAAAEGPHRP